MVLTPEELIVFLKFKGDPEKVVDQVSQAISEYAKGKFYVI